MTHLYLGVEGAFLPAARSSPGKRHAQADLAAAASRQPGRMVATVMVASSRLNLSPMHLRLPAPKGTTCLRGRAATWRIARPAAWYATRR
ncbi:hypothetical protein C4B68_01980 [Streptomyces dengpaensis]|uniref:Uncharacterized protein n=1 Tax=Streptomyces dengpaensis TaxID=2049881 RepID=A0ABM6SJD7_9ACTN|nr:hypothetical protein C4B68_01980 [Streptomyces dengpaensis]